MRAGAAGWTTRRPVGRIGRVARPTRPDRDTAPSAPRSRTARLAARADPPGEPGLVRAVGAGGHDRPGPYRMRRTRPCGAAARPRRTDRAGAYCRSRSRGADDLPGAAL